MLYTWILDDTLQYYQSLVRYYESVLESSPPGGLVWQNNHGKDQFIHLYSENGRTVRRTITGDTEMQQSLARKKFAQLSLKTLRHNAAVLDKALSRIIPFDPDSILRGMPNAYGKLPESYFFDRDQINIMMELEGEAETRISRHREYGEMPYEESDYHKEKKKTRTSRGRLARSRVEAMIMEKLDSYGIAYHYDERITIEGKWVVPDFTFEGAGGKLIFWEHMGMMSKPDYAEENIDKLRRYQRVGIIPGDNLILSFDQDGAVDMRVIDAIIRTQLIPRL